MLLRSSSSPVLSSLSCQLDHQLHHPPDLPHDIPAHRLPPPSSIRNTTTSRLAPVPSEHPQVERLGSMRRARSEGDLHGFGCASAHTEHKGDRSQGASISAAVRSSVREEETHDAKIPSADISLASSHRVAGETALESRRIGRIRGPIRSTIASSSQSRVSTAIDSVANDSALTSSLGLEQEKGELLNPMCMASGVGICKELDGYFSSSHGGNGNGDGRYHTRNDGGSFYGDSDTTELYYQKLLQSDPQNSLLLRNYAQYLSEAKQDFQRSEEYYERAILASPNDGEILSKYAKHVWDTHKDQDRAENYFERAVHATPDDCYVLASYASFLWESDDAEAVSNAASHTQHQMLSGSTPLIVSV